jgi:hypothetical protein
MCDEIGCSKSTPYAYYMNFIRQTRILAANLFCKSVVCCYNTFRSTRMYIVQAFHIGLRLVPRFLALHGPNANSASFLPHMMLGSRLPIHISRLTIEHITMACNWGMFCKNRFARTEEFARLRIPIMREPDDLHRENRMGAHQHTS